MSHTESSVPTGTAYGRQVGQHNSLLTEVGPGTPCGEFMRRYWQPVTLSERVTSTPMEIRLLGEDLIVFRDLKGRAGGVGFVVPIDDTSHRLCFAMKIPESENSLPRSPNLRPWSKMTPEERQRYPGDWEAQVSQGPITLHSEEHLATSDKGVAMLRRSLTQQIQAVQQGQDPAGLIFDPADELVSVQAGNYFSDQGAAPAAID